MNAKNINTTTKPFNVTAGETALLREGDCLRWVNVLLAAPARANGTQLVTVRDCDQFGRSKPRRVMLGTGGHVQWVS